MWSGEGLYCEVGCIALVQQFFPRSALRVGQRPAHLGACDWVVRQAGQALR